MNKYYFILCLVFAGALSAKAQADAETQSVRLTGRVMEMSLNDSTESFMQQASVEIWSNGEMLSTMETNSKGRYDCKLAFFNSYIVKYKKDGFVQKMVEIDATDFARESRERGFTIEVDMTLFKRQPGCREFEFLGEIPIARASYSKRANTLVWDKRYTKEMNDRLRTAVAECRK
jgi:hypothetical protein